MRSYVIGGCNYLTEGVTLGEFGIFYKSGSLPNTLPNIVNTFTLTGSTY